MTICDSILLHPLRLSKTKGCIKGCLLNRVHKLVADLTWQDGVKDTEDHGPEVKQLQTDAAELRNAQPHKHVIGIKQTA